MHHAMAPRRAKPGAKYSGGPRFRPNGQALPEVVLEADKSGRIEITTVDQVALADELGLPVITATK